jgi:hypothetical protein
VILEDRDRALREGAEGKVMPLAVSAGGDETRMGEARLRIAATGAIAGESV